MNPASTYEMRLSANVLRMVQGIPGSDRALEFETKADETTSVPTRRCSLSASLPLKRHPLTLVGRLVHTNESYSSAL